MLRAKDFEEALTDLLYGGVIYSDDGDIEIKRIILALQKADKDNVATPADWRPGNDVIVPTAGSCGTAKERVENQTEEQYCLDWFMCFRRENKGK